MIQSPPFPTSSVDTDPDVAWPHTVLDLEPETCHCLVHGNELPCFRCERDVQHWKEEMSA